MSQLEFVRRGGQWVQNSRYPFQEYFEVFENQEFIGILMDRYDAPRPGWWFYLDGQDDMSDANTSWWLCFSGDEVESRENLAIWKFKRRYFAAVQSKRMG